MKSTEGGRVMDIDEVVGIGLVVAGTVATLGLVGSVCFLLCAVGKWLWYL